MGELGTHGGGGLNLRNFTAKKLFFVLGRWDRGDRSASSTGDTKGMLWVHRPVIKVHAFKQNRTLL